MAVNINVHKLKYKDCWEEVITKKIESLSDQPYDSVHIQTIEYVKTMINMKAKDLRRNVAIKAGMVGVAATVAIVPGGGLAWNGAQCYAYAVKCAKGFGLINEKTKKTIIKGLIEEALVAAGLETLAGEIVGSTVPGIGSAISAIGALQIPHAVRKALKKKAIKVHLQETVPHLLNTKLEKNTQSSVGGATQPHDTHQMDDSQSSVDQLLPVSLHSNQMDSHTTQQGSPSPQQGSTSSVAGTIQPVVVYVIPQHSHTTQQVPQSSVAGTTQPPDTHPEGNSERSFELLPPSLSNTRLENNYSTA